MTAQNFPPAVLRLMRDWILDCVWADLESDDVTELSDEEVVRGVRAHFDGGITGFLQTL